MSTEQKPEDKPCDEPEDQTPPTPPENGQSPKPKCEPLPEGSKPPALEEPKTCEPRCECPGKPPASETCFDKLIDEQTRLVNEAERAKLFKGELEDLLKKAIAAKQAYPRDKFEDFNKRWAAQDKDIVRAIDTVICNVKCWWCVIECEICPLLYKIREIEQRLDGSGALIDKVHSLRDLRYWHERNRDAKAAQFNRIKAVLTAWGDPAKTIDANLAANHKLIQSLPSLTPAEALLQVFMKLIPLHLAIAPRPIKTNIDPKYIDLCGECDEGVPDDCCGPDVGVLSARQRLTEPQAYIVDPDDYFDILCCLATERYLPAKDQLAKAESDLAGVQGTIDRLQAELERRKKSVFDDYRGSIATPIECDKYKKKDGDDCGCDGDDKPAVDPTVR